MITSRRNLSSAYLAMVSVVAVLLLAACNASLTTTQQAAVEQANVVSGTINFLEGVPADPSALIEVELRDVAIADAPATIIAAQSIPVGDQTGPIPFELVYDPALINDAGVYSVAARVFVGGALGYISEDHVPVITGGAPTSGVEVVVSQVDTLPQQGPLTGTLNGVVTYLDRSALPPEAVVEAELVDVSSGVPSIIATQQVTTGGQQVPIAFSLTYDPAQINPIGTYLVNARIVVGETVAYSSPTGVPVLTNGAPTDNVEVLVTPVSQVPTGSGAIRGIVTTPISNVTLDPSAVLQVELREPMLADAPATAQVELPLSGSSFPISFELPYESAAIAADRSYVVAARILQGNRLLYASLAPVPVLTNGAPASDVTVRVAAMPDPASPGMLRGAVTSDVAQSFGFDSEAILQVELREPMLADAPAMSFTHLPLAGLSFPVPFELPYDPAAINPDRDYSVFARVIDNGQLTHATQDGVPVLTKGALAMDVQVPLVTLTSGEAPTGSAGGGGGLLTGVITTDQPTPLDPAAVYFVDLREAGTTGDPMVQISSALNGAQFPIPFEVPYNPADIDPAKEYVVGARILLGEQVLYASAVGVPVLTMGAPTTDVVVNIPPQ